MGATSKRTVQVTLPDGQVVTRTSATKVYTHAVIAYDLDPWYQRHTPKWVVVQFSQSAANAQKAISRLTHPTRTQLQVVPVDDEMDCPAHGAYHRNADGVGYCPMCGRKVQP